MKSPVIRRTVYIHGRKTCVTLEDAFWSGLKEIAQARGASVRGEVISAPISSRGWMRRLNA
jgi:predicted DNA-binding ribbon-helix-helix protein